MFILGKGYNMTLKIKITLDGVELIDFDKLPDNIKDAIIKILNYGKYIVFNNRIDTDWDEETMDVLYRLNKHFDLFIMKGE